MKQFSIEEARRFLEAADVFFGFDPDEDEPDDADLAQTLNLNDTFGWALAFSQYVEDKELPRVAELFWHYGWLGIVFWAAEKNGIDTSSFEDIRRGIQFVQKEEELRQELGNELIYTRKRYWIG